MKLIHLIALLVTMLVTVVQQKDLIIAMNVLLVITITMGHANKLVLMLIIKTMIPNHAYPVYKDVKNVKMVIVVMPVVLIGMTIWELVLMPVLMNIIQTPQMSVKVVILNKQPMIVWIKTIYLLNQLKT